MPFFPPTVCRKFANVLDCVGCWREPEVCFFASAVLWKSSCCLLWFLFECTMRLVILNFPVSVPPRETCAMKTFTLSCNMFFRQTHLQPATLLAYAVVVITWADWLIEVLERTLECTACIRVLIVEILDASRYNLIRSRFLADIALISDINMESGPHLVWMQQSRAS